MTTDFSEGCGHDTLKSYRGYTNVYFCPDCGKRFSTEPKLDQRIE